jgi:hypothetical protein
VSNTINADGSIDVTVTATAVALYVTLYSGDQGHFSDNAMLLLPSQPVVLQFVPMPGAQPMPTPGALQSTLRIDHLALYL